jgi:signal recognition particle subunit SRP54
MLKDLSKSLGSTFRKILSRSSVDPEDVDILVKNLQRDLLKSDVDVLLIKNLSENIRRRCLKEKIPDGVTLREHVIKVVYEELVNLLGEKQVGLMGKKRIMFVGLFGSGKTTTAAKIANRLKKKGLKPAMIACDYHRPAAPDQLKQLGDKIHIPVHISKEGDPFEAIRSGLMKFKKYDSILIDTAGRDALDDKLAKELKEMAKIVKPDEVVLVLPADIGRIAGKQAEEFHKLVGVTGVVITKMDGTAKGGGALSACSATAAKVKFIGTGEKIDALEEYDPVRFVGRLLGMGDLQALLEKAKEAEIDEDSVQKIISGKFTLKDFYDQISGVGKMGSLSSVMDMIPGLGGAIPEDMLVMQEENLKKYGHIMASMTEQEKINPDVLQASRIKRIAKGSGTSEKDVRGLLKQYKQSKKIMKKIGGTKGLKRGQMARLMKKFGLKM